MSWETRGRHRRYTRTLRRGGRVVRQYLGTGAAAELAARADARAREARRHDAEALRAEEAHRQVARAPLLDLYRWTDALVRATLTGLGYHQHAHGQWRKRRMAEAAAPAPEKVYPAELKDVLERAHRGDAAALPALRQAFDDNPELAALLGDLVGHAEQALLTLVGGSSLLTKEAVARQVAGLRQRLAATAGTELERLLVDRVVLSWMEVYYDDADLAARLAREPAGPAAQAAQRRLDAAQRRYLAAVKALATLQKLARPALSPLDLVSRSPAETAPGPMVKLRRSGSPAAGVPVAN
jgi:hypothetical protein